MISKTRWSPQKVTTLFLVYMNLVSQNNYYHTYNKTDYKTADHQTPPLQYFTIIIPITCLYLILKNSVYF